METDISEDSVKMGVQAFVPPDDTCFRVVVRHEQVLEVNRTVGWHVEEVIFPDVPSKEINWMTIRLRKGDVLEEHAKNDVLTD